MYRKNIVIENDFEGSTIKMILAIMYSNNQNLNSKL